MSTNCKSLKPSLSLLYYLLGNLRSRWHAIGKSLGVSDATLEAIKKDHRLCDRRMIEMLECWRLNCMDCSWTLIVRALQDIGEVKLSRKVEHYTKELERIKAEILYDSCRQLVPLKHYCYDDWFIKELYGGLDIMIEERDKRGIVNCLQDAATKWYQIGIALSLRKRHLDGIEERTDELEMKLSLLVDRLVKLRRCKWKTLIQALIDMDLSVPAQSLHCLALKIEGYTLIYADFNYRKFRRKDFASQNETKRINQDIRCQHCFRDICNMLRIPYSADVLEHIRYIGQKLSANDFVGTSYKPIHVDEKVKRVTEISIELSEEIEEHAKELADSGMAHLRYRDKLRKHQQLSNVVLEADQQSIKDAIEILSQNGGENSQLVELETESGLVKMIHAEASQMLSQCEERLLIVNEEVSFVMRKLRNSYAVLQECRETLSDCQKFAGKKKTFSKPRAMAFTGAIVHLQHPRDDLESRRLDDIHRVIASISARSLGEPNSLEQSRDDAEPRYLYDISSLSLAGLQAMDRRLDQIATWERQIEIFTIFND